MLKKTQKPILLAHEGKLSYRNIVIHFLRNIDYHLIKLPGVLHEIFC